jgi:DNA-binding Lrp family transcriptional regulator
MAALNRGVQALVSVQVRPLSRTAIDTFSKFPEVMSVFVLAGGDDFLLHVAVQDLDHLHGFLLDRLTMRKEIAGFRTSVVYQRGAQHRSEPAPGPAPVRDGAAVNEDRRPRRSPRSESGRTWNPVGDACGAAK